MDKIERRRLYGIWWMMHDRCTNSASRYFNRYGGRGIRVCKRWSCFETFVADVGPRPTSKHTLDRKNNARGYCPSNVQWATRTEQARNRDSNVYLTYRGRRRVMAAWAESKGLTCHLISQRLSCGWSVERALDTPATPKPKNVVITIDGISKTAKEWEKVTGVTACQIMLRRTKGWTDRRAVYEPLRPRGKTL